MPTIIQLVPVTNRSGEIEAFYALDDAGSILFGEPDYLGTPDKGPTSIEWREVALRGGKR